MKDFLQPPKHQRTLLNTSQATLSNKIKISINYGHVGPRGTMGRGPRGLGSEKNKRKSVFSRTWKRCALKLCAWSCAY